MEKINLKQLAAGVTAPAQNADVIKVVEVGSEAEAYQSQPRPTPETTPIDPESINPGGIEVMRFTLVNTSGADLEIFMGIVGTAADGPGLGLAGIAPAIGNGAAGLADEFGALNPKLVAAAERVRRNNMVCTKIKIITADTPAGITQRGNSINLRAINPDAQRCEFRGTVPLFSDEFNGLISKQLIGISDYVGLSYVIDDAAGPVTLEMHIGTRAVPNMKSVVGATGSSY